MKSNKKQKLYEEQLSVIVELEHSLLDIMTCYTLIT